MHDISGTLIFWVLFLPLLLLATIPAVKQIAVAIRDRGARADETNFAMDLVDTEHGLNPADFIEVYRPGSLDEHWRTTIKDDDR